MLLSAPKNLYMEKGLHPCHAAAVHLVPVGPHTVVLAASGHAPAPLCARVLLEEPIDGGPHNPPHNQQARHFMHRPCRAPKFYVCALGAVCLAGPASKRSTKLNLASISLNAHAGLLTPPWLRCGRPPELLGSSMEAVVMASPSRIAASSSSRRQNAVSVVNSVRSMRYGADSDVGPVQDGACLGAVPPGVHGHQVSMRVEGGRRHDPEPHRGARTGPMLRTARGHTFRWASDSACSAVICCSVISSWGACLRIRERSTGRSPATT